MNVVTAMRTIFLISGTWLLLRDQRFRRLILRAFPVAGPVLNRLIPVATDAIDRAEARRDYAEA